MSQVDIEIDKADLAKIKKVMKKMTSDDMKSYMRSVGARLANDFRMGFRQSLAPDNTPWAPITYRDGQPLNDTGRLRQSITFKLGNKAVEIGTNVDYAPVHQFGGGIIDVPAHTKLINQAFGKPLKYPVYVNVKAHKKKTNIKARPFLGIEKRQKDKIIKAFEKHIIGLTDGKAKK